MWNMIWFMIHVIATTVSWAHRQSKGPPLYFHYEDSLCTLPSSNNQINQNGNSLRNDGGKAFFMNCGGCNNVWVGLSEFSFRIEQTKCLPSMSCFQPTHSGLFEVYWCYHRERLSRRCCSNLTCRHQQDQWGKCWHVAASTTSDHNERSMISSSLDSETAKK